MLKEARKMVFPAIMEAIRTTYSVQFHEATHQSNPDFDLLIETAFCAADKESLADCMVLVLSHKDFKDCEEKLCQFLQNVCRYSTLP